MKKINSIFSILLAIIIVISALPISASAANVSLTVTSSSTDVKINDVVTIEVVLSENSNVNAITFDVKYDDSKLEYASHSSYQICGFEEVSHNYAKDKIRFTAANFNSITVGGAILTVQFKVLSASCSNVSIDVIEVVDKDLKEISTTANSAVLHSYGEYVTTTEPTCTGVGEKVKSCSCGEKYTEEIPAKGHTETKIPAVEPTCTATGLTEGTKCSVCGDILKAQTTVHIKDHSGQTIPAVEPTCTTTGLTEGTKCSVCGDILKAQTTVNAKGHNFINGSCTVCGVQDPAFYSFSIKTPSHTTIKNKDGIILRAVVSGNRPAGSYVKWTADNGNFKTTEISNEDAFKVIAENKGNTTFTATLYDAQGQFLSQRSVTLYSKSGFFDKIGGFFRSLFGMTTIYND